MFSYLIPDDSATLIEGFESHSRPQLKYSH